MTTRIGLISDTHMPFRSRSIPQSVYTIFDDVDLILHAGDIGELWVLDQLSKIAPVVAVHGNDDSAESIRDLPYKQLLHIGGHRIQLWHSHAQDRPTELALRAGNTWPVIQDRLAHSTRLVEASIIVCGHTHVAMNSLYKGIRIINPGAVASGNLFTRQRTSSVAILTIDGTGDPTVIHYDLENPDQSWLPPVDLEAPFVDAFNLTETTILSAELQPFIKKARGQLVIHDFDSINAMLSPLSFAVWENKVPEITKPMLIEAIKNAADLDPRDYQTMMNLLN